MRQFGERWGCMLCLTTWAMLAPGFAQATDIVGLGAEYPEVRFALPATAVCQDVTPDGFYRHGRSRPVVGNQTAGFGSRSPGRSGARRGSGD